VSLRLYILEITAVAFGLMLLAELILLIVRRLKTKSLYGVTSNMDIFVYVILLVQVNTGLWTTCFYCWGSSWFAIVLTPYIRSIFSFDPDTIAVVQLP
jgi:nitrate reductase gamma subunit